MLSCLVFQRVSLAGGLRAAAGPIRSLIVLTLVALSQTTLAAEPDELSRPILAWSATDIRGVEHRPLAPAGAKAMVLIFTLPDCPIANGYVPELNRLRDEFNKLGVRFYLVQTDPDLTEAAARQHAEEYDIRMPVLLDHRRRLVDHAQATHTPEAALYAADGKLLYRGRIDDRHIAYGKRRAQPTARDLRNALQQVLAGQPVSIPRTEVVGCRIPPARATTKTTNKPSKP